MAAGVGAAVLRNEVNGEAEGGCEGGVAGFAEGAVGHEPEREEDGCGGDQQAAGELEKSFGGIAAAAEGNHRGGSTEVDDQAGEDADGNGVDEGS